jgi:formylglycine-generating enzyme required for sulfatase activity
MSFEVGDMVGDYQITGVLGVGGMGKVYRIKNQISEREDALKVLLPNLADAPELEKRFTREIKVLASLDHPNIASLRTAFRLNNQLLMVMELVEGTGLDDLIKQGPITCEQACDYIRQVLAALAYAHRSGLIHRDIKPANMMLTADNIIKLMDFGIAKSKTDRKLTETGMTMGSLFYMSPEQIQGAELDGRADLYSVGVSLYELVTGSRPFRGKSDFDIMLAQMREAPPPPIQVNPALPQALNDVVLMAMEKDPARRFQTAEEFGAALGKLIAAPELTSGAVSYGTTVSRVPTVSTLAPASAATPAALPSTNSTGLLKLAVALGVGVVLAGLLLVFLIHRRQAHKIPTIASAPVHEPLLVQSSGDMVFVPGGEALLGPNLKRTFVGEFYIDKVEVTNRIFLEFCQTTGHPLPPGIRLAPSDNPVVNVTNDDARSFCRWAGKRLPTPEEWEKAARGANGQLFPWGSQFDYALANVPRDDSAAKAAKLASAMAYESGKSPYGALNMLGNAWEWVDAVAPAPPVDEFRVYQKTFRDLVPPLSATELFYYARGGSYEFVDPNPAELISDPGSPLPARARKPDVGFRCAMDAKN